MSVVFRLLLVLILLNVSTNTAFAVTGTCDKVINGTEEKPTLSIDWVQLKKNSMGKVDLNSMLQHKLWRKASSNADRKVMIHALMEQKDVHASIILRDAIQSASYIAPMVNTIRKVLESEGENSRLNRILSEEFGLVLMFGNSYFLDQNKASIVKSGRTPIMTIEQLSSMYQENRRPLENYLLIISTVLDMSEENDLFTYEFYDHGINGFARGNINILRYAIRHADLEILSFIVNHKKFFQTQNHKQAKVLLSDVKLIDSETVAEKVRMETFITMTEDAYRKVNRSLGRKFLDLFGN